MNAYVRFCSVICKSYMVILICMCSMQKILILIHNGHVTFQTASDSRSIYLVETITCFWTRLMLRELVKDLKFEIHDNGAACFTDNCFILPNAGEKF